MSYYSNYIGYKQTAKVGTTFIPIVTGEPISSVVATILATTAAFKNGCAHGVHCLLALIPSSVQPSTCCNWIVNLALV